MSEVKLVSTEEYERQILGKLSSMLDEAIDKTLERKTYERKFVSQTELRELFSIGQGVINEWEADGLSRYEVGRKVMYDLDEVTEYLKSNKKI